MQKQSSLILDTDVLSFILDRKEQPLYFAPYLKGRTLFVSFVNVAEIYHGAYKAGWGPARLDSLKAYLRKYAVLPFVDDLCLEWAKIQSEADEDGHPIGDSDCWIAACARYYGYAIVTNNGKHFQYVRGIRIISPNNN